MGEYPTDPLDCDGWLISGSKWSAYDKDPWIAKVVTFIQELDKTSRPTLGICFGHQLIHHALGGQVDKSDKGWGMGLYPVEIKLPFPSLLTGEKLNLIAVHQDQVEDAAPGFITLAGSAFCPNAITYKGKHILTMQPHPEFSGDFLVQLTERLRDKAGDEKVNEAQRAIKEFGEGDRMKAITLIHDFFLGHA